MGFMDLASKKWEMGQPILINKLVWNENELEKIIEVLASDWFAGNSKFNLEFEKELIRFSGLKHFVTTNSGSSAIEVAVQTLIQKGIWHRGDKILHPGLTFPTSISSSIFAGLIPVYADVGEGTYVLSAESIRNAFEKYPDIKGAIVPALLGNTPDIDVLLECLNGKPLILDSCDVMGSKWDDKEVGSYGTFAAYSFYGSHHISTMGVGGGLGTNNDEYADFNRSLVFWGRDFATDNLGAVENFLKRYSYKSIGLDAQMSAPQAAFGLAQLQRLPEYIGQREAIFRRLAQLFVKYQDYFILPERVSNKADVSWFCYPLTIKSNAPFTREFFVKHLVNKKIECRPVMATILDHFPYGSNQYLQTDDLHNASLVGRKGFFIPACPMELDQLNYYIESLEEFMEKY